MATFTCEVVELKIRNHPNADALEIAEVGLFQSIVRKGIFKSGDKAVYIPEAAICPEEVMKACYAWDFEKNKGKLTGANNSRVKAVKLRGILSQGLIYEMDEEQKDLWNIGKDVQEALGVTKYEPKIPDHFFGGNKPKIAGMFFGYTPMFDVENVKKYHEAFLPGEEVIITEKIHGTCCVIGCYTPWAVEHYGLNSENLYKGRVFVGTKNLTKRGIVFNPNDLTNLYARIPMELGILDKLIAIQDKYADYPCMYRPVCDCLIGEIFGSNVQDLSYGLKEPTFKAFEYWNSYESNPNKFSPERMEWIDHQMTEFSIDWVPVLYRGPYNESLLDLNAGMSHYDPSQIREGIVIRSAGGDKLFKYVSEAYLLRKGDTSEYE